MADLPKTKSDNYDALAGIFDFMFEESKKPPQSRRPVRPKKGVSLMGNDELADSITAALGAPGVFITDSAVEAFNDAIDFEVGGFNVDGTRSIKFSLGEFRKMLKDPDGYMKKASATAKNRRKLGRALFLGRAATDFMVTAWAQKKGNREVQQATLAMTTARQRDEDYKDRRAVGQYRGSQISSKAGRKDYRTEQLTEMDFMVQRNIDLLGQGAFRQDWENLSANDRAYFTGLVSAGKPLGVVEKELASRFGSKVTKNFDRTIRPFSKAYATGSIAKNIERDQTFTEKHTRVPREKVQKETRRFDQEVEKRKKVRPEEEIVKELKEKGYKGKELERELLRRKEDSSVGRNYRQKIDVSNPKLYLSMEESNLVQRIAQSEGQEKRVYQRLLYVLKGYKAEIGNQIDELKGLLNTERDPNRRKEIKREIDEAKRARNTLRVEGALVTLGRSEGYINSLQGVWSSKSGEGLFTSIFVTQHFFDERRNTILNPMDPEGGKIAVGKYNDWIKGEKIAQVGFLKSKGGEGIKGAWNDFGEKLYYANPKTWINTLYTGEGFAWLADRRKGKVDKLLKGLGDNELMDYVSGNFSASALKEIDTTIEGIMNKIKLANKDGSLNAAQLKKIEKLLNSSATFEKLAKFFSAPSRLKDQIKNLVQEKIYKAAREKLKNFLGKEAVKKFLLKYGGEKVLTELTKFAAEGGIKKLVQGLVTTIAGAIGLPSGPGSIVVTVVTWVATEIIWRVGQFFISLQMKLVKLGIEATKIVVLGIFALFLLALLGAQRSVSKYDKTHYVADQTPPGEVLQCEAYDYIRDPDDGGVNCRKNVPIPDIPCLNVERTIKLAKTWVGWQDINTSTSHVEECLGDVLQRSLDSGLDPIFSVAIWIHESAASNYDAFDYPIEDFGIHGRADVPTNDFNAQIEFWLNYPDYVYGICEEHNLENFIAYYWFGNPSCEPESEFEEKEIQRYISELQMIYEGITNGGDCAVLPDWPSDGSGGGGGGGPEAPEPQPPVTDEECVIGTGPKYCTQGWKDVHCWSHEKMTAVYPVDLGYVDTITAPQFCGLSGADCKITTNTPLYCFSASTGGDVYQGSIVDLYASYGGLEYNFHLIHVKPYAGVTIGKQLDAGEGVASVEEGLTIGNCWTGKHLHLSVKQNGGVVDPLKTLQSFNCEVPNEGGCADSPCCVTCACQYPCITDCSKCP